ncbi:MAG: hypothetical protein WD295_04525, partial [Bacteroidota bacterium]
MRNSNPFSWFLDPERRFNVAMAVASGVLLGAAFPPSPLYSLAYVAFIPFFVLFDRLERWGQVIRFSYLSLFAFNLVSLYWVGGFSHMRDGYLMLSGSALVLLHPAFFLVGILPAWVVRQRLGRTAFFAAFPLTWIGFEYLHSLTEFAFPWVTVGNSQAYDLARSQVVEYTSVYGLSFLVIVFNILAYSILVKLARKDWSFRSQSLWIALGTLMVFYWLPLVYGEMQIARYSETGNGVPVRVGFVQPNIDPFEKWGEGSVSRGESFRRQFHTLIEKTLPLQKDSVDLVVWPETAVPFHLLHAVNAPSLEALQRVIDSTGVGVFTGIPHAVYYDSATAPASAE